MSEITPPKVRPIRSFVLRQGRLTDAQDRAFDQHWPRYGLEYTGTVRDFESVFGRQAERVLEIGFGNGEALRYAAAATGKTKIAGRAKTIQTLLGDHQDSVVSREHLIAQADAAAAAGEDTFTYGLLYAREADLAARCRAALRPALRKLDKAM